jgi:hypothetical protein
MSDNIIPKPAGNVLYSKTRTNITEATIESKETEFNWLSLSIINDGANPLEISLNDLRIRVNANEEKTDNFEAFDSVQVEPVTAGQTIAYRIVCRG